jgi:hypothetical protein
MRFFFYVQNELVIDYKDKRGVIQSIYTNREIIKKYIDEPAYCDINGSDCTNQNFKCEIERIIKDNTYNIMLYENGTWLQKSYKNKYKTLLLKMFPEIIEFIKVYKKNTAYEIML